MTATGATHVATVRQRRAFVLLGCVQATLSGPCRLALTPRLLPLDSWPRQGAALGAIALLNHRTK